MKIGIDFDNTIANYEFLFEKIAYQSGYLDKLKGRNKFQIKKILNKKKFRWERLQGKIYGKYMSQAKLFPYLARFLFNAKAKNYKIYVVSHKTKYGHFDRAKYDLREEAMKWMRANDFFDKKVLCINPKNIFFCNSQSEKIKKITNCINLSR